MAFRRRRRMSRGFRRRSSRGRRLRIRRRGRGVRPLRIGYRF